MKFGIELECYNVSRNTVATALVNAGLSATIAGYAGNDYSKWQVKTDGSINGTEGFEVVSPVLEGEAGLSEVRKVCAVLNSLDAKVNSSCGFHVHHDASGWGVQEFRNLFKRFVKFEGALDMLQPSNRRADQNAYILSVANRARPELIDSCRSVRQLSDLFGNRRYFKLNLQSFFRSGTVEFRHHSGTTDADKIVNYIRLTAAMVKDARDHVAIKAFTQPTDSKKALSVMLAGMVRRNNLTPQVAKYYEERHNHFATL